ncbi:hypothetical protein [Aestuariimicrobium kwangyangense]|uniref:hypothetical protein n=1 Tax=Aestuariimicrobium kwangyangense TaxID=396389 RepID=UPI0004788078|nr:hypothetical protein [Aestuariimicrobium kwangyangense]
MSDHRDGGAVPTVVQATVVAVMPEGWRALTDRGTAVDLPRASLIRLRSLRPGQRVTVTRRGDEVVRVSIG